MSITVTGRKMNVNDELRTYAEEKVGNAIKVMGDSPVDVEVVLHREKNPANPTPAICEITVRVKGHIIRAEESDEDMHAAIDIATAKVSRQLRKYKTRVSENKVRSSEKQSVISREEARTESKLDLDQLMDELSADQTSDEKDAARDEVGAPDEIVRVKEIEFAPMTEREALIEIDLIDHDFYVYTDSDTDLICVLYRRNEGGFGKLQQKKS